jgi:putative ABC transport system permease protein
MVLDVLGGDDSSRLSEYARWAGAPAERMSNARRVARTLQQVDAYFARLPVAARATIVGDRSAQELLDQLRTPATLERTLALIRELKLPPPLGDVGAFRQMVTVEWPRMSELLQQIEQGHQRAIDEVRRAFPDRHPAELVSNPSPRLLSALRKAGFDLSGSRVTELSAFAKRLRDIQVISRLLLDAETSAAVGRELSIDLSEINFDTVARQVTSSSGAKWLAGLLKKAGAPPQLTAARVQSLLELHRREQKLSDAVGDRVPADKATLFGLSERSLWLVALSFLVCIVGVANAMLMSVTERFTEIATMKCLGAMDRFVMMMFVFEAILQGAVGGVLGLVLGATLAVVRAAIDYGGLLLGATGAAGSVGLAMLASLVMGMMLAAFAAVGPAWIAARLAPMEAMRVE